MPKKRAPKRSTEKRHVGGNAVNRMQLAQLVADDSGESISLCFSLITRLVEHIAHQLSEGQNVCLPGLGTFRILIGKARNMHVCGRRFIVPAKARIKFKVVTPLKDRVATLIPYTVEKIPSTRVYNFEKGKSKPIATNQDAEIH